VGGVEVVGRSGDVLNGGDPKGASAYPLVEIPMTAVADSTPDPSMGQECLQTNLDTAVGADASILDLKATRILSGVVAATWEVH
jgi:hypothetical protein